jgi:DNA-binding transcriptional ArsR family regulator
LDEKDERIKDLQEEMRLLKEQLTRIGEKIEEVSTEPSRQGEPAQEPEHEPEPAEEAGHREEAADEEEDEGGRYWARPPRHRRPIRPPVGPDWGDRLGDYIGEFVDDVMDGVSSELERSLFTESRDRGVRPTVMTDSEIARTSAVMSAMANEHRIRILKELTWGGMYAGDLQENLKEISPSTLSSHLDTLQGAGLIYQEKRRGRYLITISGRIAVNMAAQIAKRARA